MADINLITYEILSEYDSDRDGIVDAKKIKIYYAGEDINYIIAIPNTLSDTEIKNLILEKLNNWGY